MKDVAIFVPQFPVPSETFVITEIQALRAAGHKVSVITMEQLPHSFRFEFPIYELKRSSLLKTCEGAKYLPFRRLVGAYRAASRQKSIRNLSLLYFALQIKQIIDQQRISHLHCHFMHSSLAYGVVAAKLAGISVSSVGHGHDVYVNASDLAEKLDYCDFNIAVCQDMFDLLQALKSHSIHLLHCGVNVDKFSTSATPQNERMKLLFVGRLVDKKGLEFAFQALANIAEFQRPSLDIVGNGPKLNELKALCSELGLTQNIRFLGQRDADEIIALSNKYDAFIAPFCVADNGDKDTGPVVLKEAMAMGLPTITSNIMGCTEIVDSSCGYIVPSKDSEALRKAIIDFLNLSDAERQAMRNAARNRVLENFNSLKQGLKLSQLIEQVAYES